MLSMFPNICPDWLHEQVENISKIPDKAIWEFMYEAKVEEIFSMSSSDEGKLPNSLQHRLQLHSSRERTRPLRGSHPCAVDDLKINGSDAFSKSDFKILEASLTSSTLENLL